LSIEPGAAANTAGRKAAVRCGLPGSQGSGGAGP
jgi:hypothetical protein